MPRDHNSKFLPDPYFHPDHLPESKLQYVAWIDLMGTTSLMEYSFEYAATNICKLHLIVAQQESYDQFRLYPMNDGLYVVSDSYRPLVEFLSDVFSDHAEILTSNFDRERWDILRLAIPRAAIAYGHLYHPEDIKQSALVNYQYASSILLGEPMTLAHHKESNAAPFGIIADKSVHEADGEIKWWNEDRLPRLLFIIFDEYIKECQKKTGIEYPDAAAEKHRSRAREYLIK
ncbi:hypothetical protein [Halobacterium bonnevillei]|uniref:Uncharacterized protein n=1 Tax=Halobacterium bonnevillei TaxID=2692200 RepID=A0A6B0SLH8_9EURY|nr:hypothetical protein [Halobacterium bonnevillei]MXR19750.1 hypothetical protein [Halobacterium bonnevillei]